MESPSTMRPGDGNPPADDTGPAAGATADDDPLFDMSFIGSSDQACKECRRRKARCNRDLPTCDLCIKYKRHCLYEKHARTPLTRKHLTEVEARLERTEALVRQMRTLVPTHLRTWERQGAPAAQEPERAYDFASAPSTTNSGRTGSSSNEPGSNGPDTVVQTLAQPPQKTQDAPENNHSRQDVEHQRMLETIPVDDFEWCEQESTYIHGLSPEAIAEGAEEDSPISDGMASLSVGEREGGYLGVASGAALLRLLEPRARRRTSQRPQSSAPAMYPMIPQPNPNRHVAESMIDAYFRLYHVSYPIIHEPTFRAQYSEVIPRPNGPCWTVLAYVVAAIGVWTSASSSVDTLDMALFSQARSIPSFNFLEVGNLTLVQALTLASNYQQKRDKPNSGYNYLGLAVRMAMGLGLHKEFQGWNISPLSMEIRRRVWWTLCAFDIGATITFSRPDVWPYKGVEVSYPLNVNDKDLTAASQSYPSESNQITPYSAIATQARFHVATHECYERVISKPFPSAEELIRLEDTLIKPWLATVPSYFSEDATVAPRYAHAHAVMSWRIRNLRIIMYRPFVIRRALRRKAEGDQGSGKAYDRCLADAKSTIEMISDYWANNEHNRLAAWYSLYFLFQAALIPCICLRNDPSAPEAPDWRSQITTTLHAITAMAPLNATSARCHQTIFELCGRYLDSAQLERLAPLAPTPVDEDIGSAGDQPVMGLDPWTHSQPVGESPQTQINSVYGMLWPNVPAFESDVVMDDGGWMDFLRAGSAGSVENWTPPNP